MTRETGDTAPLVIGELLRRATGLFAERGIDTARLDAELLLADALDCERIDLYTALLQPLNRDEVTRYRELVRRRAAREPVAYIRGRRGFRHLELEVSPDVLIPRPETEHLVDWALERAADGARVLDWGTGSGAIALALATERPDLVVTAVDVSAEALAVAKGNDADGRVDWVLSDGTAALADRPFDLVVANPPYLTDAELAAVEPELGFEPRGALSSGPTGMECHEQVIREAMHVLTPGGSLLIEVGLGQAAAVADRMRQAGLADVEVRQDLAGVERMVGGRRP